jgi:O-antigen/teichoic acid export membrane protein
MNASYFAPQIRRFTKPVVAEMKDLVTQGWPFLSNAVFIAIYGQADTLLLSKMGPMAPVGWYNLGKRLSGTTMVIPVAMTSALLPTLSRLYTEDRQQFVSAVHRLFSLMMISVVPFASLLILGPRVILNLLHYGESFMPTVPVMIVLGYGIILWYVSVVAGTALIACDQQKMFSRVTGVSAAVCLPLCGACIWIGMRFFHNGAVGAVVSDVIIEACMVVFYLRALPRGSVSFTLIGTLLRATVAALPLVVLLAFASQKAWAEWAEICAALVGGLIYIPLCFATGCISRDDIQLFKSVLQRKAMGTADA